MCVSHASSSQSVAALNELSYEEVVCGASVLPVFIYEQVKQAE